MTSYVTSDEARQLAEKLRLHVGDLRTMTAVLQVEINAKCRAAASEARRQGAR